MKKSIKKELKDTVLDTVSGGNEITSQEMLNTVSDTLGNDIKNISKTTANSAIINGNTFGAIKDLETTHPSLRCTGDTMADSVISAGQANGDYEYIPVPTDVHDQNFEKDLLTDYNLSSINAKQDATTVKNGDPADENTALAGASPIMGTKSENWVTELHRKACSGDNGERQEELGFVDESVQNFNELRKTQEKQIAKGQKITKL